MEGTIRLVQACCAYASIDGRSFAGFLKMQRYDPTEVDDAKYAFTFDLCGKAYARVLVSTKDLYGKHGVLDLADLYGNPWRDYKVCGYYSLCISRTDGTDLDVGELIQLEKVVTDDLRFDYSEDELAFWFDDSAIEGTLRVTLQDIYEPDND
jgi:hypothetical protein